MNDERRTFTIADALILIAGLAAGLGLVSRIMASSELTPEELWDALVRPKRGWSLWYAFGITVELGTVLVIPFMAAWTPACLLLQVQRPRPGWRRLRRRPGFVACLIPTIVATLAFVVIQSWISFSHWAVNGSPGDHVRWQLVGGMLAGSGVLWGWVAMALCGACRPGPAWTDRLGRMTGAVWIALGAISATFASLTL